MDVIPKEGLVWKRCVFAGHNSYNFKGNGFWIKCNHQAITSCLLRVNFKSVKVVTISPALMDWKFLVKIFIDWSVFLLRERTGRRMLPNNNDSAIRIFWRKFHFMCPYLTSFMTACSMNDFINCFRGSMVDVRLSMDLGPWYSSQLVN